jgi:putative transcriptional regulator
MDNARFNELLDKIRFTLNEKRSNPWVSPNIKNRDVDIDRIRQKFGVTQAGLAEMLGVSEDAIRDWENGTAEPEKAVVLLLRIAERRPDAFLEALWNY